MQHNPYEDPHQQSESEVTSQTSWQRRQTTKSSSGLRRYPTRRINLVQGSVLSVDYPVPSAIRNSVEAKYRDSSEATAEEFTHLRCKPRGPAHSNSS